MSRGINDIIYRTTSDTTPCGGATRQILQGIDTHSCFV